MIGKGKTSCKARLHDRFPLHLAPSKKGSTVVEYTLLTRVVKTFFYRLSFFVSVHVPVIQCML